MYGHDITIGDWTISTGNLPGTSSATVSEPTEQRHPSREETQRRWREAARHWNEAEADFWRRHRAEKDGNTEGPVQP